MNDPELVLRNLPQRRVGRRDDAKHLGNGDKGNLRTAVGARDGNTAQTALGELLDFRPG